MPKRAAPIQLVAITSPNARYKDAHEALAANTDLIAELILEGRRYRKSLSLSHETHLTPPSIRIDAAKKNG